MRPIPSAGGLLASAALLLFVPALSAAQAVASPTRPADSARVTPSNLRGLGPEGATLRCRDGSYPPPFAPEAACDQKGGVLVKFRVRGTPAPLPAPASPPAAPASVTLPPAPERPPSRANVFIPPPERPAGATLLCRDGTYVVADTSALRCASRGGVQLRFPQRGGR